MATQSQFAGGATTFNNTCTIVEEPSASVAPGWETDAFTMRSSHSSQALLDGYRDPSPLPPPCTVTLMGRIAETEEETHAVLDQL